MTKGFVVVDGKAIQIISGDYRFVYGWIKKNWAWAAYVMLGGK